eukprot:312013-Lingulodinium_polyedra.AAC.1
MCVAPSDQSQGISGRDQAIGSFARVARCVLRQLSLRARVAISARRVCGSRPHACAMVLRSRLSICGRVARSP